VQHDEPVDARMLDELRGDRVGQQRGEVLRPSRSETRSMPNTRPAPRCAAMRQLIWPIGPRP
jgi:hypothetical protein